MTTEIITYGGGGLLTQLFNAIAMLMGRNAYDSILQIAGLTGFAVCGWMLATQQNDLKTGLMWFAKIVLVMDLLVIPKTTVAIHDAVAAANGLDAAYHAVDNVPVSLAVLAVVTSQIGHGLTALTEAAFSSPTVGRFGTTGLMFAARLVNQTTHLPPMDPALSRDLQHFVRQCIFPEMMHGRITARDMVGTDNVWDLFKVTASPARVFRYQGALTNCADPGIISALDQSVRLFTAQGDSRLAKRLGLPYSKTDRNAQTRALLFQHIPNAYHFLTQQSGNGFSATNILQQALMRHVITDAVLTQGAALNASAITDTFMRIKSDVQNAVHASESAFQASEWLPWVQVMLTALLYAMFPVMVVLVLIPGFGRIAVTYVKLLLWLQLWAPITAIIQFCSNYALQQQGAHIFATHGDTLSLVTIAALGDASSHAIMVAKNMLLSVPFIAGFFVLGGSYMLTQAIGSAMGSVTSSVDQTAVETTTGNTSLGNTQFNNASVDNTHSFKFDDNLAHQTGTQTHQTASGALIHQHADGHSSIHSNTATSAVPQKIHASDAIRQQLEQRYQHEQRAASSEMETYVESRAATLRDMMDVSSHLATGQNRDDTMTVGDTYSGNQAISKAYDLTHGFAIQHGITDNQSAMLLSETSGHLGIDKTFMKLISVGANERIAFNGQSAAENRELYQSAHDYAQRTHFNDTFDKATRAIKEGHFRTSNDLGARLTDDISANIEKTEHAAHQLQAHYDKAQVYQSGMQHTTDHALTMDRDETQHFMDWLVVQPSESSDQPIGADGADYILHNQPAHAQAYLSDYMAQRPDHELLSQVSQDLAAQVDGLHTVYASAQRTLPGNGAVQVAHGKHAEKVLTDKRTDYVEGKNYDNNLSGQYDSSVNKVEQAIIDSTHITSSSPIKDKVQKEIKQQDGHLTSNAVKGLRKVTNGDRHKDRERPWEND